MSTPPTDLQFERAEFADTGARMPCATCQQPLIDKYFEANGRTLCASCYFQLQAHLNAGSPLSRACRAVGAGLLAAVAGTILYYAIAATTGYEFGLIAVAVGVGVGKAVSWGSYGRGGWKYQTLAMVLTYLSIVMSYVPALMTAVAKTPSQGQASAGVQQPDEQPGTQPASLGESAPALPPVQPQRVKPGRLLAAFAVLFLIVCAAPFLGGVQSIMGLVIIGIGLYEAWKFNRLRQTVMTGPHALVATAPDGA